MDGRLSGPPTNIESHELWDKIAAMPRPSRAVDFPRLDPTGQPVGRLAIWVLSQEDQMRAAAEAEAYARKRLKEIPKDGEARQGYEDLYRNAAAVEVLFRACRRIDDLKKPFFPTPHQLRSLTVDEIGVLLQEYFITQSELGPIIAKMSEDDVSMWISRLKEGAAEIPFARLSWDGQIDLVNSLVRRIVSLQTDITSSGLPALNGSESATSDVAQTPPDEDDDGGASPVDPDEQP